MKVGLELPEAGKYFGAWLPVGKGDVHTYAAAEGVVIGQNKNYHDKIDATDTAVCFAPDGTVKLQYADKSGQIQFIDLDGDAVASEIEFMLRKIKGRAIEAKYG